MEYIYFGNDLMINLIYTFGDIDTEKGVAQAIIRSHLDFKRDPWPIVSDSAKDLVKRMLDPDRNRRLTAQQVLGMILKLHF